MDAKEALERWTDAIASRDAERILDTVADDLEIYVEDMPRPVLVGKEALRVLLAGLSSCEDIAIEKRKVVACGDQAAALMRMRAKMRSDVEIFGEKVPTAGKELAVTAALFVTVNADGKITRVERVRDNLAVARQLGITPAHMQSLIEKLEQRLAA